MKTAFSILFLFLLVLMARAQKAPAQGGGKSIIPRSQGVDTLANMDIRERLVQLAIQNPSVEMDDHNANIAYFGVKKAKSNILNNISIQGNLNEYSIKSTPVYGALFPRYNIGATLPLGVFFTRTHDINIAKETYNNALAQKNDHYQALREKVLSKYEDYLLNVDLLNLQNQLYEDVHANFLKVEKDFADAKIKVEEYSRAYRDDNTELAKQRTLERNLKVAIVELERLIGVKLSDVLNNYR